MSEITIIVGTPGAGKTLYTMSEIRKELLQAIEVDGQQVQRRVYYNNIPGVTLDDWTELQDPTTWHTLPVGSAIIVDEAHEVFPKMDHKREEPEHIKAAATLRHRGHSLILITQHPVDLHIFLRRRCTRFIYIKRPLTQGNWATVYQWPEYEEKYKEDFAQKKADKFQFDYPADTFDTYKSSQLHTKKKYIPKAARTSLKLAVVALVVLAGVLYYLSTRFTDRTSSEIATLDGLNTQLVGSVTHGVVTNLNTYFQLREPRIEGLPHTAPIYDKVTEPKVAPKYNCIASVKKCICYTQQTTRVTMPERTCRRFAEYGYFDDTLEENTDV